MVSGPLNPQSPLGNSLAFIAQSLPKRRRGRYGEDFVLLAQVYGGENLDSDGGRPGRHARRFSNCGPCAVRSMSGDIAADALLREIAFASTGAKAWGAPARTGAATELAIA